MVNELLDLSRIESGGRSLLLDDVDLGRVATESRRAAAPVRRPPGRAPSRSTCRRPAARPRRRGTPRPGPRRTSSTTRSSSARTAATVTVARHGAGGEVVTVGRGPRVGIPRGGPGADLRALLQGRPGARVAERRRHRPRPRDRPPRRRAARRPDLGRIRGGVGEPRSRSRSRTPATRARDCAPSTAASERRPDGSPARRDAQHPQPGRPLAGAPAAAPRRHGGAPAGPARAPGGASTCSSRTGSSAPPGRAATAPSAAGPAGPSTATACSSARRSAATDVERIDLGLEPVRASGAGRAAGRRPRGRRRDPSPSPRAGRGGARRAGQGRSSSGWRARRRPTRDPRRRLQRRAASSRRTPGCAAAGFRSAFAEANGAEPAVTWPSGLQAPAMDTDGDPGCLDYIWVRGAVRVVDGRLAFDRPGGRRPDALPDRPPRARRPPRDRLSAPASAVPRHGRSGSPTAATGARAGEHARRRSLAAMADPGLRRPRVRRPRSPRWRAGPAPRRDAPARPGPPGGVADLTAAELEALGVPTLAAVLAAVPRRAFLDVELKGVLGRRGTAARTAASVGTPRPSSSAALRSATASGRPWKCAGASHRGSGQARRRATGARRTRARRRTASPSRRGRLGSCSPSRAGAHPGGRAEACGALAGRRSDRDRRRASRVPSTTDLEVRRESRVIGRVERRILDSGPVPGELAIDDPDGPPDPDVVEAARLAVDVHSLAWIPEGHVYAGLPARWPRGRGAEPGFALTRAYVGSPARR